MPTYELKCPNCGERSEVFCKMEDRGKQLCEKCKTPLEVMPSACWAMWLTDSGSATGGRMPR